MKRIIMYALKILLITNIISSVLSVNFSTIEIPILVVNMFIALKIFLFLISISFLN